MDLLLKNKDTAIEYCNYLAERYNETLDGKYRIKYNDLYTILYKPMTDSKKEELLKSFLTSLNIYPIEKIHKHQITFKKI